MKTMTQRELMDAVAHLPPLPPDWPLPVDRGDWGEPMTLQEIVGMGTQSIWTNTAKDGDRHIKRKCGEYADHVAHIARDLKQLAQIKDADSMRISHVVEVQGVLAKAAEQLKDLGNA